MRSLGQFYPVASPVHDLDPRAKLVATAVLVAGLFLIDSTSGLLFVAAALVALVAASHIPVRDFLRLLRPVLFIVVLTVVFQVFFSREGATVFEWGVLEVHAGGLRLAFFLALRILLLVGVAGVLTATTAPVTLADGIEDLLSPLKKVRFPAHEEEAEKIKGAQAARGADFSEGGPLRRARSLVPVLVPLTVGAFRRADELAEAMESRGYRGGEGRTRFRELHFRKQDALALSITMLVLLVGILL